MRFVASVQLAIGLVILPQAVWGISSFLIVFMPLVVARAWPSSGMEWTLLIASLVIVIGFVSCLGSAGVLFRRTGAQYALKLSIVTTSCFWGYIAIREHLFTALGVSGPVSFYLQSILAAILSSLTALRLYMMMPD